MRIDGAMLQPEFFYPPPVVDPRILAYGLRGFRGFGDAASILAQQTSDQTNPFLTPAYYATVAAQNNNECAVDPSSPACAVWQQIQAPTIAQTNENAAQLDIADWCSQNAFNVSQFGTAPDTANCNGSQPKAAVVAQVTAQGAQAPSWETTTSPTLSAAQAAAIMKCPGAPASWSGAGCPPGITPVPASSSVAAANAPPAGPPAAAAPAGTPGVTQQAVSAAANSAPVNATGSNAGSTSSSSSTSSSGFTMPAWLTEESVAGIQNWVWIAAGAAALFIVPKMIGRRG